jgi:molybdopterin converting factor subunit 1
VKGRGQCQPLRRMMEKGARRGYDTCMRVRVLFFGQLKDIVGRSEEAAELGDGDRVEDLYALYGKRYPELARFRGSVVASVNQSFADWGARLAAGDEVAFLPPVSGGSQSPATLRRRQFVELVREPIRVSEIVSELKMPEDGAVAVFEGIVRNHSKGRISLYLDYEAYEGMALAKMREVAATMQKQFSVDCVAIVHRLGRLEIGETSVFIGVSSAHRGAAFDACRYGIDTLKKTVPIWKREYFADGAVWADGEIPEVQPDKVRDAPASNSGKSESTS